MFRLARLAIAGLVLGTAALVAGANEHDGEAADAGVVLVALGAASAAWIRLGSKRRVVEVTRPP